MNRRITIAAVAAITTLTLTACGGEDEATGSSTTQHPAASTTSESSDNGPVVDRITAALDKLEAPWGNVKYKGENEEAVATDVWNLDINNRNGSILVFLTEDDRKDWEQAAIWLDAITVAYDNVGISLNSKLGREDSLKLAPKLADELGGRVTTGDSDMFRDEDEWATHPDDAPNPTTVPAPEDLGTDPASSYSEEVAAHNAEVEAYEERVKEYDAAWVECLGDVDRPDYYERQGYCEATIPEP